MHHAVIVAIISGLVSVTLAVIHHMTAVSDKGDHKRKNDYSSTTPRVGPEVIKQLHSLERRMDKVETRVGKLETKQVLQGWNGYEEVNQKMLN